MPAIKVVTSQEMREIERRAEHIGLTPAVLMESAGRAVAHHTIQRWRSSKSLFDLGKGRILVLVGPGNNGGDGLVAARYLANWGVSTAAYIWNRSTDDQRTQQAEAAGVLCVKADNDPGFGRLREFAAGARIIIDALLGTGVTRPIEGTLKQLLRSVRELRTNQELVALDLPSGLNSDTGGVDEATLKAETTVTLGAPKVGLYLFPGASYCGKLIIGDIGLPPSLFDDITVELLTRDTIAPLLPERPPGSHKGTFGKALIIAGSANYLGAPYLACAAATRVGAGLVTLAIPRSLHPILASKLVETTFLPLDEVEPGEVEPYAVSNLWRAATDYDATLIGPGLGQGRSATRLLEGAIEHSFKGREERALGRYMVIDADGLNLLSKRADSWWKTLGPGNVLTPHPGEMARLRNTTVAAVEGARLAVAKAAAAEWAQVVVLKGPFTVVAEPKGWVRICPIATAALATAGTGDVLAGTIIGLAAQGLAALEAALAGVYLHARCGQLLSERVGPAGPVASDLLPLLPEVIAEATALTRTKLA